MAALEALIKALEDNFSDPEDFAAHMDSIDVGDEIDLGDDISLTYLGEDDETKH